MNTSTPDSGVSAVSDPHTEQTKRSCSAAAAPGPEEDGILVGEGTQVGHLIWLHPELEEALQRYAIQEGIAPGTAITEAVRAYLGIEDGVVT